MGSFAGLLKAAGHDVRGSDENVYPPMSDKLKAWGIEVMSGYRAENLDPAPELVVVGNVVKKTNPEAIAVMERGLSYTSFPKALGDLFLANKHSIVIAGTHGKTTTTSMVAFILAACGRDPGMLVGGVPANFGEGFRLGHGEHFVVEGDEYDTAYFDKVPKFLHYRPTTVVLTSLEFDHADIYADVQAIERELEKLIHLVPATGRVIACATAPLVVSHLGASRAPYETYTARPGTTADWWVRDVTTTPEGSVYTVMRGPMKIGVFKMSLYGTHNIENALAAIAVTCGMGLTYHEVADALAKFEGVARRQTLRAEIGGVRVIDDFAHHPTAVKETISAIRARFPDGRLFAIFEPRTATSSRKYFQDLYAESFDGADEIIIAGVGRKELAETERLDTSMLAERINERGKNARNIGEIDIIVSTLVQEAKSGDTLLFMSNGGFGGIYTKIEAALRSR